MSNFMSGDVVGYDTATGRSEATVVGHFQRWLIVMTPRSTAPVLTAESCCKLLGHVRRWQPYTDWEDYQAGLYGPPVDLPTERAASAALLANPEGLRDAMSDAVLAWPGAALHNLSNTGSNRRAWLGQAACGFAAHSTREATCVAWWDLTDEQREAANAAADSVLAQWEQEVTYGAETLFAG